MNKMIKTLAVAAVAGLAVCGSAVAAPKNSPAPGGRPPAQQVARREAPRQQVAQMPQRGHGGAQARPTPKPQPRHEVAHHKPAPRPEPRMAQHRPEPRHDAPKHKHHHSSTLHTEDWCSIGASLVGGLIGGLVGAAM